MKISEEELLKLLDKAYEAGWSGYKDLKETKINEILEEFIKNNPSPLKQKEMFTTTWTTADPATGMSYNSLKEIYNVSTESNRMQTRWNAGFS